MDSNKPRVRFAPSPTGQLHLGGARTALFNYLFAKKNGGQFLLRIEDTDKVRSKQEYTVQICDSLRWLGLDWDEDIIYQSNRTDLYKEAVEQLRRIGKAYPCFCSKETIAKDRLEAEKKGGAYLYPGTCRSLDEKQVEERIANGEEYSVRIKVPEGQTSFSDKIYGDIKIENSELDDFIIARTDGTPVYNLVVVVDDNNMEITHIIRGEDHVSNTHKQLTLYSALRFDLPEFAHLPMILGSDKKRLSKRHGATGVQEYKDLGYLPEVMVNYLALLGWNPGTEQEIFNPSQLVSEFSIDRVQKKSAVFDERKLEWVNKQHIQKYHDNELLHMIPYLADKIDKEGYPIDFIVGVIRVMKERVVNINEFMTKTDFFFNDPKKYDEKAARKRWNNSSINDLMEKFVTQLNAIVDWKHIEIENTLRGLAESEEISAGKLIHPTRLAISGVSSGPSLFDMMVLLGKDTCIRRIKHAIQLLPYQN